MTNPNVFPVLWSERSRRDLAAIRAYTGQVPTNATVRSMLLLWLRSSPVDVSDPIATHGVIGQPSGHRRDHRLTQRGRRSA